MNRSLTVPVRPALLLCAASALVIFAGLVPFLVKADQKDRNVQPKFDDFFVNQLIGTGDRAVLFGQAASSAPSGGSRATESPNATYIKRSESEEREKEERDRQARRSITPEAVQRAQQGPTVKPVMTFYGESQSLMEMSAMNRVSVPSANGPIIENETEKLYEEPEKSLEGRTEVLESFLQQDTYSADLPTPVNSFEGPGLGMTNFSITGAPPDTTMAVGPNHVVAWVNSQYAVFNKTGTPLLGGNGFVNGNTLFSGLGNLCETTNRGDPILQYDRLADRWILSQFAFNSSGGQQTAPYLQCIAVSTTGNPLGTYFRYTVTFSPTSPSGFNDYGKLGIWPDGYYISYNMFGGSPAGANTGAGLCVSDRVKMLAGDPTATTLCAPVTFYAGGAAFLPVDMDGTTAPTDLSQGGLFIRQSTAPALRIIKLKADFAGGTVTATDGFGGIAGSFVNVTLPTTTRPCNGAGGACVAQPGTSNVLDTLGDRLMYRAAYRNIGGIDRIVVAQSVDPDGLGLRSAAMRWYEIRLPLTPVPVLFQNGTYDPGATGDRWMGSVATDSAGNMMMGYSVANATTGLAPSLAITGRLAGDALNTMQAETIAQTGTGVQTGTLTRWGDYTTIQIDPADDQTFWFIGQYLAGNGTFNWRTRIVSYRFAGAATPTPTNTPTATPTNTPTATPTNTPTATPTNTPTATPTNTPTATPTNTPTATPTNTPTATPTNTPTATPTNTPTATPTNTPTATPTNTPTATPTNTPTATPTNTPTATPTATPIGSLGFEGDVAPRPNGDSVILATDVTQLRRFATGLDTPGVGTNEGQRADCAPRASSGDGLINSGDVVQGRRYATGLDPLTGGGGPAAGLEFAGLKSLIDDVYAYFFGRELTVASQKAAPGSQVIVPVEMTPYGDEVAASFTLEYDALALSNPRVALGDSAPEGSVLTVNTNESGRIGILVDSTEAMTASAMPKQFVLVTFDVAPDTNGETPVAMTGSLTAQGISDAQGNTLSARYLGGVANIGQ